MGYPEDERVVDATAADLFDGVAEHYETDAFHSTVAEALIDGVSDLSPPQRREF